MKGQSRVSKESSRKRDLFLWKKPMERFSHGTNSALWKNDKAFLLCFSKEFGGDWRLFWSFWKIKWKTVRIIQFIEDMFYSWREGVEIAFWISRFLQRRIELRIVAESRWEKWIRSYLWIINPFQSRDESKWENIKG